MWEILKKYVTCVSMSSALNQDVLKRIAELSDYRTQATLHRASKLTETKMHDRINALETHAKKIAKQHFVLYDIAYNVINISITHNGKPEPGGIRLGFRSFDIEGSGITVLDSNEDSEGSSRSSSDEIDGGSPTNLVEITGFRNETTQNLILHAAACYYVIDNLDKILPKLTVSIPNKKGWANMARSILDMIVMKPSMRPRNASWYVKFDMEKITSDPLLDPPRRQQSPTLVHAPPPRSLHDRRRKIVDDAHVLNTNHAKELLKRGMLEKSIAVRREATLKQLEGVPRTGGGSKTKVQYNGKIWRNRTGHECRARRFGYPIKRMCFDGDRI